MANNLLSLSKKLIRALNTKYKCHIVLNYSEFFGAEGKPVRVYSVKDSYNINGKYGDKELFRSASIIYVVLFIRDLYYSMNDIEIAEETNEGYIKMKEKRNAEANIEYMKEKYIVTHEFSEG